MRHIAGLIILGMALVAPASAAAQDKKDEKKDKGGGKPASAEIATLARSVLRRNCLRCHNGKGSEGGDFNVLNRKELVDLGYVNEGKAEESYLLTRVVKNEMPPRDIPERPSVADGEALKVWINAGAPDFPAAEGRAFVTLESVLTQVRDALRKAERQDRPYLRFFTLHNLYNNPVILDDDLRTYRAALSKALNSLSWKPRVSAPKTIDSQQVLFVIDVRNYDWDRNNLWEEILKAYPYGLKYRNHPIEELRRLDEDIADLSGCALAIVRGDWFTANATRPPLYYPMLQVPTDAKELEKRLNVDVKKNFQDPVPERIARAGFAKSGVSGQNRLVERHDALHGAYWKSYDFKPGRGRAKLTRFPLGPLNMFADGKHPYPFQAFVHDGGEIIFNLPNGLQGYMLIDGKDARIDEGPIEVVSDALKTGGTPAITNGVSCMACHKHGVIRYQDAIRDSSAVFGQAEQAVKRLYPAKKEMDQLLDQDEQRFLAALEKAIGPFVRQGADKDKSLKEFAEPVGEVARLHRLVFLDLKTVACELDIENPQDILVKVGEKKLKQLGLETLLKDGGLIGRLEWEAVDGVSLMQELARELRYTPWQQQ